MSSKNDTEVIINGKIYTISGYESEEYLQKVASYINNKINEFNRIDAYKKLGLDTLSAALGEDSGTLEDVYEPYLIMCGFINRTPRGRMATASAYKHLGYVYNNDEK